MQTLKDLLIAVKKEMEDLRRNSKQGNTPKFNNCNVVQINASNLTPITLDLPHFAKLLRQNQGIVAQTMASIVREHHFNRDRPEDMNVYISNNKDTVGRYHDGQTWCQTRADHLVWEIFDRYRDFVDVICDTLTDTEDEERSNLKESLLKQFKSPSTNGNQGPLMHALKKEHSMRS